MHSRSLLAFTTLLVVTLAVAGGARVSGREPPPPPRPAVLDPEAFASYVATFNHNVAELYPQHVPNAGAWAWLRQNVPLFECADKELEEIYSFCDLVISGLVGLRPRPDDLIEIHPLLPEGSWDYFCLDQIRYHGRWLTILYDRTGERYRKGRGLRLLADGKEIAMSEQLGRVLAPLPAAAGR